MGQLVCQGPCVAKRPGPGSPSCWGRAGASASLPVAGEDCSVGQGLLHWGRRAPGWLVEVYGGSAGHRER